MEDNLDIVVVTVIVILTAVFLGSLAWYLILVCRHRRCRKSDLKVHLIEDSAQTDQSMQPECQLELDDVHFHPEIEKILEDGRWVDDATGLIPHCLKILKSCHQLTEQLVAMAMRPGEVPANFTEIACFAKKISPRVDDVVRCMYPPLEPRLLEARMMALVLSVSQLVLVARSACGISQVRWIDDSLCSLDQQLAILRNAALEQEQD